MKRKTILRGIRDWGFGFALRLAAALSMMFLSACVRDRYPCPNPQPFGSVRVLAKVAEGEEYSVALDAQGTAHIVKQRVKGDSSRWYYTRADHSLREPTRIAAGWPDDARAAKVFPVRCVDIQKKGSEPVVLFAGLSRDGNLFFASLAGDGEWATHPAPPDGPAVLPDRVYRLGGGCFEAWWMPDTLWEGALPARPSPDDSILAMIFEGGDWKKETISVFHETVGSEERALHSISWRRGIAVEKLAPRVVGVSVAMVPPLVGGIESRGVYFAQYDRDTEAWEAAERLARLWLFQRIANVGLVSGDAKRATLHLVANRRTTFSPGPGPDGGEWISDADHYLVSIGARPEGAKQDKRVTRLQPYEGGLGGFPMFDEWRLAEYDAGCLAVFWQASSKWRSWLKWAVASEGSIVECGFVTRPGFGLPRSHPRRRILDVSANADSAAILWAEEQTAGMYGATLEPPLKVYYAVRSR